MTKDIAGVDWYQRYSNVKHFLKPLALSNEKVRFPSREKCRVLILGCGSSPFGRDMQKDGWTGPMIQVDFSSIVIDQMKHKYPDMDYRCYDATKKMPLCSDSFDLIVVKGTLDAVLCSIGSKPKASNMVAEIARLLAPSHGIFFLVSNAPPENRREYLEVNNSLDHYWSNVMIQTIPSNGSSSCEK